jgi:hypothetical protein
VKQPLRTHRTKQRATPPCIAERDSLTRSERAIIDEIDALLASEAIAPATLPAGPGLAAATTLASSIATVQARPTPRRRRRLAVGAVVGSIGIAALAVFAIGGRGAASHPAAPRGGMASLIEIAAPDVPAGPPIDAATDARLGAATDPSAPASTIRVKLDSTPHGSQVVLDGRDLGKTPYDAVVPRPGHPLWFTLRRVGYQDRLVEVAGDRDVDYSLALEPRRPASGPGGPHAGPARRRHIGSDEEVNPFQPPP